MEGNQVCEIEDCYCVFSNRCVILSSFKMILSSVEAVSCFFSPGKQNSVTWEYTN